MVSASISTRPVSYKIAKKKNHFQLVWLCASYLSFFPLLEVFSHRLVTMFPKDLSSLLSLSVLQLTNGNRETVFKNCSLTNKYFVFSFQVSKDYVVHFLNLQWLNGCLSFLYERLWPYESFHSGTFNDTKEEEPDMILPP